MSAQICAGFKSNLYSHRSYVASIQSSWQASIPTAQPHPDSTDKAAPLYLKVRNKQVNGLMFQVSRSYNKDSVDYRKKKKKERERERGRSTANECFKAHQHKGKLTLLFVN